MFVIQSYPRCGSHLLRSALLSHDDIHCYSEVFNPASQKHGFPILRPTVKEVIDHCCSQDKQTGFLAHHYVGLADHEVGEYLSPEYRAQEYVRAARGLWAAIPESAPVVTLWRANLLERYVSKMLAQSRQLWNVQVGERRPPANQMVLDWQAMLFDFKQTESLFAIARNRFPDALMISYEELSAEFQAVTDRVQTHLGVEVRMLSPGTQKIGLPIEETIVNLEKIRNQLRNSRYAKFLETSWTHGDPGQAIAT